MTGFSQLFSGFVQMQARPPGSKSNADLHSIRRNAFREHRQDGRSTDFLEGIAEACRRSLSQFQFAGSTA